MGITRNALTEDAALRAIVEGVEAETGERFFASLVRHLAAALAVQYSFVSELSADRKRFRTLAVWGRGTFLDNFEIPVAGTPCESVLCGEMSHHGANLQALFPEDKGLADWNAESYCGVPLIDSKGVVVGHLAIIHDEPMPDGPRGIAIMRIFAARARAEIERKRAEDALRASETKLSRVIDSAMDAIVTFDAHRRIELWNGAAEKIFGVLARDAVGQPLDRFVTVGFRKALEPLVQGVERGSSSSPFLWAPGGLAARRSDGGEFPVEATLSHVVVVGKTLFTLILRDIDERRRSEEELSRLYRQNEYLQEEIRGVHNFEEIIGRSRALSETMRKVQLVAATDSSVLILGETGTGKELIARAVHSGSKRKDKPLIKVNCAAIPSGLIESELFGHEKGAFTGATERRIGRFQLAHRGSIFLDEIGELPLGAQSKLLRVLQERALERVGGSETIEVDVRVIVATNRDLSAAIEEGSFRQDLFYRLNVFPVTVPPLRERIEDIPLLANYFVARYAAKIGRKITRVPAPAMERLLAYAWPGNVRELENVIERAVILSTGPDLEIAPETLAAPHVSTERRVRDEAAPPQIDSAGSSADGETLESVERSHILSVLEQTGWRIDGSDGAARILDL
ncbi:MAG: sigma 54-interacting transcriptional regulator, partial [Planctomycetes bacterium]|nr:sigma 54-interacting transcriptional regulator [Planctomycetota bacterium]